MVALAFILADRLWLDPRHVEKMAAPVEVVTDSVQISGPELTEPQYPPNSIAVLPFINMSSDAALTELISKHEQHYPVEIASVLAYRGEADRAFAWLDKAVAYGDPGLSFIAGDTWFSNLYEDPRWLPFLERIGRSPAQLAAIEFEVKLPE